MPRDEAGRPNFKYVATHICDSIKRRLKAEGVGNGLQGEFGIGLLSFWTVGDRMTMISSGNDQRSYQMTMSKGDSAASSARSTSAFCSTDSSESSLPVRSRVLESARQGSGERCWYSSVISMSSLWAELPAILASRRSSTVQRSAGFGGSRLCASLDG